MDKYHIFIWAVPQFSNESVFIDVACAFQEAIINKGYSCSRSNEIAHDRKNIIFGANLCTRHHIDIPQDSIIVNLEQLTEDSPWAIPEYIELMRQYEVWDYAEDNVKWLIKKGAPNVKKINIGYSPCLETTRRLGSIEDVPECIDVLFYGTVNGRRNKILQALANHPDVNNVVVRSCVYGIARDHLIRKSKIILNIYYYESKILEVVRVSHALANKKCIISETSRDTSEQKDWEDAVVFAEYDNLVETTVKYLQDDVLRRKQAKQGYNILVSKPQELPLTPTQIEQECSDQALLYKSQHVVVTVDKDQLVYGLDQEFILTKTKVFCKDPVKQQRYNIIQPFLIAEKSQSFLNIGCLDGYIGFSAFFDGVEDITLVEYHHKCSDQSSMRQSKAYLRNIDQGITFLKTDKIKTSLTLPTNAKDIVFISIDGIFQVLSHVKFLDSFDSIIKFLRKYSRITLFIEWSDSKEIIERLGQLDLNVERFNVANMLLSLHRYFPYIKLINNASDHVWIASDKVYDDDLTYYTQIDVCTSKIYIDPTRTFGIKIYSQNFKDNHPFERDLYWFKRLKNCDRVPKLISYDSEKRIIIVKDMGNQLNDGNRPEDWKEQCKDIICQLLKEGCYPKDVLLKSKVLVKDQRLLVCDFSWCPLIKLDYTIEGKYNGLSDQLFALFDMESFIMDAIL